MRFTLPTSLVALAVLAAAVPQPVGQMNGVAIPIAKRSGLLNTDKSVSITALRSHVESTKAYVVYFLFFASTQTFICRKVLNGLNNFQKNTGAPHPSVLKGTRRRGTGGDALTNNGQLWYGTISVGSPPTTFTGELSCTVGECTSSFLAVDFDTGSRYAFVVHMLVEILSRVQ